MLCAASAGSSAKHLNHQQQPEPVGNKLLRTEEEDTISVVPTKAVQRAKKDPKQTARHAAHVCHALQQTGAQHCVKVMMHIQLLCQAVLFQALLLHYPHAALCVTPGQCVVVSNSTTGQVSNITQAAKNSSTVVVTLVQIAKPTRCAMTP
jgi:16S rRNA U1498 N3-methylase RsmE